jgi:UDP-N-acetylglucosamine 4-epimerase
LITGGAAFIGNNLAGALFTNNPKAANQIYNIACGETTLLNSMYAILKNISGTTINAEYSPDRAVDIKDSLADINKAKRLLDYHPEILIQKGLTETYNWFKSN